MNNKNKKENIDENVQFAKEKARIANSNAIRATIQAKHKNSGRHERSKPGRVKALNRRLDQMVLQEKKRAHEIAQIANLAAKYTLRESHAHNSARFFAKKSEQGASTPLSHRMRHARHR